MSEGTMNTDLHVYAGDALVGTIAKDEYDAILGNLDRDRMLRFEQVAHYAFHTCRYLLGLLARSVVGTAVGPLALAVLLAFTSPDSFTGAFADLTAHNVAETIRQFFIYSMVFILGFDFLFGRFDRLSRTTPKERMRLNVIRARFNVPDANQIHVRRV